MKLSKQALKKVNVLEVRLALAVALNVGEKSIQNLIGRNTNNGKLTSVAAMQIIKEKTGLKESQIIEDIKPAKKNVSKSKN